MVLGMIKMGFGTKLIEEKCREVIDKSVQVSFRQFAVKFAEA